MKSLLLVRSVSSDKWTSSKRSISLAEEISFERENRVRYPFFTGQTMPNAYRHRVLGSHHYTKVYPSHPALVLTCNTWKGERWKKNLSLSVVVRFTIVMSGLPLYHLSNTIIAFNSFIVSYRHGRRSRRSLPGPSLRLLLRMYTYKAIFEKMINDALKSGYSLELWC